MAEKIKKKKFVKIIAPRQFNERVVGESIIADPRLLIGRKININMMSLTDNPKNQNVQVKLKITELKGEGVKTEIVGYTLLPAFVKRLVRKEKKRVDYCFDAQTSDNKELKIKIFLLTLNKTTKSVLTALRKASKSSIQDKISKMSYDMLMNDLIAHKLQNILRRELSKVYPLKQCEIRDLSVIIDRKTEESQKEVKKVVKKVEKPSNKKAEPKKETPKTEKPAEEVKDSAKEEKKEIPNVEEKPKEEVKKVEEKKPKVEKKESKKENPTEQKKVENPEKEE